MQRIRYQAASVELALNDRSGSKADLTAPKSNLRFTPESGLKADIALCPFRAMNGLMHRSNLSGYSITSSFGKPGLPQSFLVSREVFGIPIRAQHVFEIGNAQRGIELPQPYHRFLCLHQPPGERIACSVDT